MVLDRSLGEFDSWLAALERRSSLYVERREHLTTGKAMDGAGKRAAFALYYGPLHFLLVREIVRALGPALSEPRSILDLGCGTGSASAAWALECRRRPHLEGVDLSGLATEEARWTWGRLGLQGRARRSDATALSLAGADGILAAFTVNELPDEGRARLLLRLLDAADQGASVLVVEPMARRTTPWWAEWKKGFEGKGGRSDEWRFPARLPEKQTLLARAAGLDARELLGRSLCFGNAEQRTLASAGRP
jgi:SAM-dependent methyltransferase